MLGWKTEHFLGFLIVTFIACVAWPRPLIVGLALMATAGLLEALQGLTPDRVPDLPTALCGAGGATGFPSEEAAGSVQRGLALW
jgi:hypothetical protein